MGNSIISPAVVGKRVHRRRYLHCSLLPMLPPKEQTYIQQAAILAEIAPEGDFHVIKLDDDGCAVSLLDYPDFFDEPFPALARAWRVDIAAGAVSYRDYRDSLNPPILHRKELLLPPDHPRLPEYYALTETAEQLGLFADTNRIGFRQTWMALIGERGYRLERGGFVPIGNLDSDETDDRFTWDSITTIARHRTALSRAGLSAPVQALLRHGLLSTETALFDYGCGRGDDVRRLQALGIAANGWDPYYAPDQPKHPAPLVNLGFVINVIENFDERVAALQGAWALSSEVLAVATMLETQYGGGGQVYSDGIVTRRGTFQKYFTQAELKVFIQQCLDVEPIAVAPGLYFVFRDPEAEQRFLANRQCGGTGVRLVRAIGTRRTRRPPEEPATWTPLLDDLQRRWLELGRPPEGDEVDDLPAVQAAFGSLKRALKKVATHGDATLFDAATEARRDDLRVYLALQEFYHCPAYRRLEAGLQRDIKALFGDYASAVVAARRLLFQLGDVDALVAAVRRAAEQGLGWQDEADRLQLDTRLIPRLPALLRVYVGCAAALYGDPAEADLIKLHPRSGKLTLLRYDDYSGLPLPRLKERVKLKFRDQDLELYEYGGDWPAPYLYDKSRYMHEELCGYAEQRGFDEALAATGAFPDGYPGTAAEFDQRLMEARYSINEFRLERSRSVPDLDAPCGRYFRYRDLIECGEAQARTDLPNLPCEPDSYTALHDLCVYLLDPIIDWFGMIRLTYGFCSAELARHIPGRIAPKLDQHAAHEKNRRGKPICPRLGAAVDFIVEDEDMGEVTAWIATNLPFDRLYYYGPDRPIHLSYGPEMAGSFIEMRETVDGRQVPKRMV